MREFDHDEEPCDCDDCRLAVMHQVAWDDDEDAMMSSYSDYGSYGDYDYDDGEWDDEYDEEEDDAMAIQFTKVMVTPQASRKSLLSLELEESGSEMGSDSSDSEREDDGVVRVHITLLNAPLGVAAHQRVATRRGVDAQTLICMLLSTVETQRQEYVLLLADESGVVEPYSEARACDVLASTKPELGHFVVARRRDVCREEDVLCVGEHPHLACSPRTAARMVGDADAAANGADAASDGMTRARSIKDITGARVTSKHARGLGGMLRRMFA